MEHEPLDVPGWYRNLKTQLDAYRQQNGKYPLIKRGEVRQDAESHEYVKPDGTTGFVVFEYKTVGDEEHRRSFGIGDEVSRYKDWSPVRIT